MKYRREVFTEDSEETLKSICLEISVRFEIEFVEIGYESDHVHFLIQSFPWLSVTQIVRVLKNITARELFRLYPEININYGR